jgi:lactoylglutathione lyase
VATRFYENVFGFKQGKTSHSRDHTSRHMSDGETDLALMLYDSEDAEEAKWAGPGPRIHHWGIEVADKGAFADAITRHGGTILSKPDEGALKFRAPDGTLAEIVGKGRYEKGQAKH